MAQPLTRAAAPARSRAHPAANSLLPTSSLQAPQGQIRAAYIRLARVSPRRDVAEPHLPAFAVMCPVRPQKPRAQPQSQRPHALVPLCAHTACATQQWHPDRHRGDDGGAAQRRFQEIQEAYEGEQPRSRSLPRCCPPRWGPALGVVLARAARHSRWCERAARHPPGRTCGGSRGGRPPTSPPPHPAGAPRAPAASRLWILWR